MQLVGVPTGSHDGFLSEAHHSLDRPPPQSIVEQLSSKTPFPLAGLNPGCMWKVIESPVKGACATAVAECQLVLHDVLHATS